MSILIHLAVIVCIFALLALGLNLAVGFTGLLNFGYLAWFGLGAYTSALLAVRGVPYPLALLAAAALAGGVGWLVGLIIHRLQGDYVALVTLGLNFIVVSLLLNWKSLTRGPLGVPGIPDPKFGSLVIATPLAFLGLAAVVLILAAFFMWRLTRSRFGKLLEAVRDDEVGLSVFGKNVFTLKLKSLFISGCYAGVAGSLYAHYISYIEPTVFGLTEVVVVFTIIIVGGLASLSGTLLASLIVVLVPELIRWLNLPGSVTGPGRHILYATVLLSIIMFRPRGLWGKIDLGS